MPLEPEDQQHLTAAHGYLELQAIEAEGGADYWVAIRLAPTLER